MPNAVISSMQSSAMMSAMPCSSPSRSEIVRLLSTVCISATQVHVAWRDVEGDFLIRDDVRPPAGATVREQHAGRTTHRRQSRLHTKGDLDSADAQQVGVELIGLVGRREPIVPVCQRLLGDLDLRDAAGAKHGKAGDLLADVDFERAIFPGWIASLHNAEQRRHRTVRRPWPWWCRQWLSGQLRRLRVAE